MNTEDEMIEIIRAKKRGDDIQSRDITGNRWQGWCNASWPPNFAVWQYRVKPSPREWYGEILPMGGLHIHTEPFTPNQPLTVGGEFVKVREVIE